MPLLAEVKKLRRSIARQCHGKNVSSGATVEVDYFALVDLLDYFDETKEAARQVKRAQDALEGVFFRTDLSK